METTTETSLKPLHKILTQLTGEARFDVALHLATKDLVRLRLQEAEQQARAFESRYGMSFDQFEAAWKSGQISEPHSYEVEKNYWEWEAAHTDQAKLKELLDELP